jgi:hypothetical protein
MPLAFSILRAISHHSFVAVLYNPILLWGVGRVEVSLHPGVAGEEARWGIYSTSIHVEHVQRVA